MRLRMTFVKYCHDQCFKCYFQAFEDNIRKNRTVMTNWLKYAAWEESQLELQR